MFLKNALLFATVGAISYTTAQATLYTDVVSAQNPAHYYRLSDLSDEQTAGSLTANTTAIPDTTSPALTSAGGFQGFSAGNTWASFDGAGGSTLTTVGTNWGSDAGSLTYWLRPQMTGDATKTGIFANQTGGGTVFSGASANMVGTFSRDNGSMGIRIDSLQTEAPVGTIVNDTWQHVAYTWQRNTGAGDAVVDIYVNGARVGGTSTGSFGLFTIDAARFGKEIGGATRQLEGSADELAIWNRVLSAGEISAQYNASMIPEPGTSGLLLLGALLLWRRLRVS